jgi:hypothetical protein
MGRCASPSSKACAGHADTGNCATWLSPLPSGCADGDRWPVLLRYREGVPYKAVCLAQLEGVRWPYWYRQLHQLVVTAQAALTATAGACCCVVKKVCHMGRCASPDSKGMRWPC